MPLWSVDPTEDETLAHRVAPGVGHGWLTSVACALLRRLGVGASITNGTYWWSICEHDSVLPFETAHGVETQRWAYNEREMRAASERKRARLGTHDGLHDYFAPIVRGGEVAGLLVVGPFATQESAAAQIQGRWRKLTGRQGHPADPEFAAFLQANLDVLVLAPDDLPSFVRLLESVTTLMAGEGPADALVNDVTALTYALAEARAPERMWTLARGIVDERSLKVHFSAASLYPLSEFGVTRSPDQVLVGLLVNTAPETDPVDEAVRRHSFQRACAKLAQSEGETLSGRLGDHGAFFLIGSKGSAPKKLAVVRKLSERASQLARKRFGFALHCGASVARGSVGLDRCFQAALSAAELALTRGTKLVMAQAEGASRGHSLRLLREELARIATERADLLAAKFDRYLEAISARGIYRIEPAGAELQICFERVAEAVLRTGALDQKSFAAMCERLDRAFSEARTVSELFDLYRTVMTDLAKAVQTPALARQARGLQGALDFIHQHYGEPIHRELVAKASGFSPDYFSELFKLHEGITFESYLVRLRLDRAKELLTGTDLNVTRIAELAGYGSSQYLCRVFRRVVGSTPLEYRRKLLPDWAQKRARGAMKTPSKYKDRAGRSA